MRRATRGRAEGRGREGGEEREGLRGMRESVVGEGRRVGRGWWDCGGVRSRGNGEREGKEKGRRNSKMARWTRGTPLLGLCRRGPAPTAVAVASAPKPLPRSLTRGRCDGDSGRGSGELLRTGASCVAGVPPA